MASTLTGDRPERAVGMPLHAGGSTGTIAGVIEDTYSGSDGRPLPMIVVPMPASAPAASLLVLADDLAGARQAVRAAVTAADPTMPLMLLQTLEERIDDASNGLRQLVTAAATFGLLSVALAGAGLHSLLSYTVRRRRHEIGVRVALGARSSEILRLTAMPVVRLVSTGAVAGVLLAVGIAAVMRAAILGVSPVDPRGLLPSVAILLVAAMAGAAGPTLQAIRIHPMDALREE
jgi:predicted lysophospholipase L1 biosynthesis ABC-type transport system permease subunit